MTDRSEFMHRTLRWGHRFTPAVAFFLWALTVLGWVGLHSTCRAAPGLAKTELTNVVDREAVMLVQNLVSQRPTKALMLNGAFHIRHSNGKRSDVPVTYSIQIDGEQWQSVYRTQSTSFQGPEELTVIHQGTNPNRYLFTQVSLDGTRTNSLSLTGMEATASFAGSDFWLSDLGLEFLHWPQQRLVRDAKITMRLGRPCKVLESINPTPETGTYSRVVSWIDSEQGSLIYAEAYDLQNKRFKVFSLKGFTKVEGHWQVRDMELRNDKANSRTHLEFVFEAE